MKITTLVAKSQLRYPMRRVNHDDTSLREDFQRGKTLALGSGQEETRENEWEEDDRLAEG